MDEGVVLRGSGRVCLDVERREGKMVEGRRGG